MKEFHQLSVSDSNSSNADDVYYEGKAEPDGGDEGSSLSMPVETAETSAEIPLLPSKVGIEGGQKDA